MDKKEDLRVIKTKQLIKDCFLELIEEKGYSKVTITDITKKAMINRNTFYLHYIDKEDLIDKIVLDNYKKEEPRIASIIKNHILSNYHNKEKLQEIIITDIIDSFLDQIEFYRILLMDPGLTGYLSKLKTKMKESFKTYIINSIEKKIAFEFVFEGVYGVISEWIKRDFTSKDELSKILSDILYHNWHFAYQDSSVLDLIREQNKNNTH